MNHVTVSPSLEKILFSIPPRPVLIKGEPGTGRGHHALYYISQKENLSNPLQENPLKSPDVLTISAPCSKDDFSAFLSSLRIRPLVLSFRYALIREADLLPKDSLDLLLKLMEDCPSYLRIFLTSRPQFDLGTVSSRALTLSLPLLSKENLISIMSQDSLLRDYLPLKGDFHDTLSPQIFLRYDFPGLLSSLLISLPYDVDLQVQEFLKKVSSDSLPSSFILTSFLTCLTEKLVIPSYPVLFKEAVLKTLDNFRSSLFRYYLSPRMEFYISLRYQLVFLFTSLSYLGRLFGVKYV